MARIKIELPEQFHFSCEIPVRITDINYGGHVGNDTILSIIHEARMQFFKHFSYTEMQFAGVGIILADAGIEFKAELFYGDTVVAYVTAGEFNKVSFDVFYKLEKQLNNKRILVALAKTGVVCYDYEKKKIVAIPLEIKNKLTISNPH
jgi:YbgC/YbaW family acyl-CoA thioester hydrolase